MRAAPRLPHRRMRRADPVTTLGTPARTLRLTAECEQVYAGRLSSKGNRCGTEARPTKQLAEFLFRAVNQHPFQNVIHERPGGIGGYDISDDERPPWLQQLVSPIDQIHH